MLTLVPKKIEDYARAHSRPEADLFKALAEATMSRTDMPQMQVGPLEGALLRLLVRLTRARRVLEIGTFTGYSALAMAEGMPEDGTLITCDIDPETTEIAREHWAKSPHGEKIDLRIGPALDTIAGLAGEFDFVFIDADKENYSAYWDAVLPKVRDGGLIVVDNVLWSGRVLAPEEDSDRAIVAFNDKAAADSRAECVLLTVRDGVLLAWKKPQG